MGSSAKGAKDQIDVIDGSGDEILMISDKFELEEKDVYKLALQHAEVLANIHLISPNQLVRPARIIMTIAGILNPNLPRNAMALAIVEQLEDALQENSIATAIMHIYIEVNGEDGKGGKDGEETEFEMDCIKEPTVDDKASAERLKQFMRNAGILEYEEMFNIPMDSAAEPASKRIRKNSSPSTTANNNIDYISTTLNEINIHYDGIHNRPAHYRSNEFYVANLLPTDWAATSVSSALADIGLDDYDPKRKIRQSTSEEMYAFMNHWINSRGSSWTPTAAEYDYLVLATQMTKGQLDYWLINERRRQRKQTQTATAAGAAEASVTDENIDSSLTTSSNDGGDGGVALRRPRKNKGKPRRSMNPL
ncbi:hypothetical protein GQ42DRAFT_152879 [Ramicandelaber brevisporus]|nr:hypothetical protein GQ42DRAFT_152879 [Ramicandelaber brevisporus]